jgi:hypothetical protein
MTRRSFLPSAEHALAMFGLLLVVLLAKLVTSADPAQRTALQRAYGFLARRAIDAIAVIGWLVDRLAGLPRHEREAAVAQNHSVRHVRS